MIAVVKKDGTVLLAQAEEDHSTEAETGDAGEGAATTGEEEGHGGVEAPNPILPETNEIIWGGLSFLVLFFVMVKYGMPAITKMMDARAERIQSDLDAATSARTESEGILEEYRRQLADARNESNRIIEEARQTADQLRRDLMTRAESEVAELRQRSAADIDAAKSRAMSELRAEVSTLAIDLAERVVGRNLDSDSNRALVDSFITEVGATNGASR